MVSKAKIIVVKSNEMLIIAACKLAALRFVRLLTCAGVTSESLADHHGVGPGLATS